MQNTLSHLLRLNHYSEIPTKDFSLQLLSHPDYPHLKAITDTFDYFGIPNIAAAFPKESWEQLPDTFLALLVPEFALGYATVRRIGSAFELTFEGSSKKYTSKEFLEIWNGSIAAIEPQPQKRSVTVGQWQIPTLSALGLLILIMMNWQTPSVILFGALTLMGLIVSYLIAQESAGIKSTAAAAVCGIMSKPESCRDVINSDQGKVFGKLKLSDLTVSFFVTIFITTIVLGFNSSAMLLTYTLALPVILISIYLQAMVLKKWCALCLTITAIILPQFALIALTRSAFDFQVLYLAKMFMIGLVVTIAWFMIKGNAAMSTSLMQLKADFMKFKRTEGLFEAILNQSVAKNPMTYEASRLHFGSRDPLVKMSVALNPFCGYCVKNFGIYDRILSRFGEKIGLTLLLPVDPSHEDDMTRICLAVTDIYISEEPEASWAALKAWFAERDTVKWLAEYSNSKGPHESKAILEAQSQWCKENRIGYTPATLINNRLYPIEFKSEDLDFAIESIIESTQARIDIQSIEIDKTDAVPSVLNSLG